MGWGLSVGLGMVLELGLGFGVRGYRKGKGRV